MRRFAEFDAQADEATVQRAEIARVRSLATWAYLWLVPGFCFVRQRSNFIQGWRAAAAAGASLAEGDSAGAVGLQGVPPLGSWMMLPDLTTPATQTVLPSNDALYGASHVELDLLGPVVVSVPENPDGRYYSVAIMDAMLTNVGHIGPKWTGNGPSDHLVVPPGWTGAGPEGMPVIQAPTPSICLYHRVLVDYQDGDLEHVREWMRGVRITQLSKWGQPDTTPDEVPTAAFEHGDLGAVTDPWEYFRIGFAHLQHNPPPQQGAWLHALLQAPELAQEPAGRGPAAGRPGRRGRRPGPDGRGPDVVAAAQWVDGPQALPRPARAARAGGGRVPAVPDRLQRHRRVRVLLQRHRRRRPTARRSRRCALHAAVRPGTSCPSSRRAATGR